MIQTLRNILTVLSQKERKTFFTLIILNTLVSIADLISLALLLLIVNFYVLPGNNTLNFLPAWLLDRHSPALIAAFLLPFSLKSFAAYLVHRLQYHYAYCVASGISKKELFNYFETGYAEHITVDSAVYIRKIGQYPVEFSHYVLAGMQQIISQVILIILAVACILFYKARLFLLLLLMLLPPVFLAASIMKKKIRSGRLKSKASSEKALQHLKEALNAYVESNIYHSHDFFVTRYGKFQNELNDHLAGLQVVQGIPARLLEVFAVLGLFILVTISQWSNLAATDLITIGAFMAAAYKIIPGIVKIMNAAAQVKAYEHTVINPGPAIEIPTAIQGPVEPLISLEFKNVSFYFKEKRILKDLSFCIQKGDMLGISGVSGRGKTTILNLIPGFFDTQGGSIFINNKQANTDTRKKFRNRISYSKQQAFLLHDTVLRNITLTGTGYNQEQLEQAIRVAGLSEWLRSLPQGLNHVIGESGKNISGGQQKRITIARALYKNSDLIILDEPFSELDEASRNELLKNFKDLAQKGKIVILVTHNKDSLPFCNKQMILDEA